MKQADKVDIVVGIPSYNEADTIPHVVKVIDAGLDEYFSDKKAVIVNVDNDSPDNTKEAFLNTRTHHEKEYISTPEGVRGKGYNISNLFRFVNEVGARAVIIVDGDLKSITKEWVKYLGKPILEGYDYVAPFYSRHQFDGTLTNHICYPVMFGMLATDVRQPIGGEFGFSPGLMNYWLKQPWSESVKQYGIDIFMSLHAVLGGFKVCQSGLGAKVHKTSAPKLGVMFEQVVGTLFTILMENKRLWLNKGLSDNVVPAKFGLTEVTEPHELEIDMHDLKEKCQIALRENLAVIKDLLDAYTFLKIYEMLEMDFYELDILLWTQIFYTLLYRYDIVSNDGERRQIVNAIKPLYLARSLSFNYRTWKYNVKYVEREIRNHALVFASQKHYLWGLYSGGGRALSERRYKKERMDKKGISEDIFKRFGQIAVKKGYIKEEDLYQAMKIQIKDDLYGRPHRLLGIILFETGLMGIKEIEDVLTSMES